MRDESPLNERLYRFGVFEFEPNRRLLWKSGEIVPLSGKTADVLVVLIEHRARVVEKDELIKLVWPDTVVEENNLARHISNLRKVLQERRGRHEFILTVAGHGYRFVAAVEEIDPAPGQVVSIDVHQAEAPPEPGHPGGSAAHDVSPVPAWTPRRRLLAGGLAAAAAVLAAAGVLMWKRAEVQPWSSRPIRQLTFDAGFQREPTWSPDRASLAYTSDRSGNSDIWVMSMATSTPLPLTSSPAHDWQPSWSPDGRWIAFRSERDGGGLYVVAAAGGAETRIAPFGYRPQWSADSTFLLFSSSMVTGPTPDYFVVGRNGGQPVRFQPRLLTAFRSATLAWHPKDHRISIWGRHKDRGWTFVTAAVEGDAAAESIVAAGVRDRIAETGLSLGRFTWGPSQRYLYFEGRSEGVQNVWRVTVDPRTLEWIAGPDRLTTGGGDFGDLAVTADGSSLVFSLRNVRTRLWAIPFDAATGLMAGDGRPVTSGGSGEYDAAAPRDGTKVAYRTVRGDRQEMWEQSLDGGRERLLIGSREWRRSSPRWSPDGSRLAYARTRTTADGRQTEPAVGILNAADGGETVLATPMQLTPDDWSSDGEWILGACRYGAADRFGTCLMPVRESSQAGVRLIASDPARSLICQRFSPDQRWISFMALDPAQPAVSSIHIMPATGGPWIPITGGLSYDDKPRWAPDGRTLYWLSNRGGFLNIWGRRFDAATGTVQGEPFQVTSFDNPAQMVSTQLGRVEIAVAANRLFVPITESQGDLWVLEGVDR